jgi:hypothetical protein
MIAALACRSGIPPAVLADGDPVWVHALVAALNDPDGEDRAWNPGDTQLDAELGFG